MNLQTTTTNGRTVFSTQEVPTSMVTLVAEVEAMAMAMAEEAVVMVEEEVITTILTITTMEDTPITPVTVMETVRTRITITKGRKSRTITILTPTVIQKVVQTSRVRMAAVNNISSWTITRMHKDRIFVPAQYSISILQWYHNALNHCGEEKLRKTFNENFFSPRASETIKEICSKCEICQVNKTASVQYGHLPPRTVTMNPWETVAVDLIGPWKFKVQGATLKFHALTMIDQDTNLVEAMHIQNKNSSHIATLFENNWLSRYPRPAKCIHDQGTEFTGSEFQEMLNRFNIRPAQITTRNPQGNSIVKECIKLCSTKFDLYFNRICHR